MIIMTCANKWLQYVWFLNVISNTNN